MRARAVFAIPGDLASRTGGYAYDREVIARAPVFGVAITPLALPGSFPAPDAEDLRETAALLRAIPQEEIVFIDGLAFGAFTPDLLSGIGQKIVAQVHHPLALESGHTPARAAQLQHSERVALAHATHVIVPSAVTKAVLVADYGVPESSITIALPGTARAARASGGTGAPHLLAVGSLVPRKGFDVLVTALADLRALDWRLTIAGSPHRAPEHATIVRDMIARHGLDARITLAGEVDEDALESLYAQADLFVLSSLYEGYGMVLGEAMVRGLPIVATTGGAAADTVPDQAALKVPPGDARALGAALQAMIGDARLRADMAAASYMAGQALPAWDDTAQIVADVLARVAGGECS